jgi:hypothetical protein
MGHGMYLEDTTPNVANDLSAMTPEPAFLLLGSGL